MEKYLNMLENTRLFYGADASEIKAMLSCLSAEKQFFEKGACIFRRGDSISRMALILSGEVHIQKEDFWGNLSILNHLSEGDVFGEVYAALGGETITSDAVAVRDTEILLLDVNKLMNVCSSACVFHKKVISNLMAVMAMKNKSLTAKLEHMSQRTTREKLLSYLSEQSIKAGSSSFDISFNRQQLADYLSVDRSAMSNELCKMRDEGLLVFERNHFRLK